jgi:endonuclease III
MPARPKRSATAKPDRAKPAKPAPPRPVRKQARPTRRPTLRNATPEAADEIYRQLVALYPDAHCELDFRSPYELLAATILSAQCTDKRVNMTTPALFAAYPGPREQAAAPHDDVEAIIKSTGFFRAKAKSLIGMAGALVDRHDAQVPADMEALVRLPGVGRKTANVVLGNAFDINVGVVVDTHVGRLAVRLGLTKETDPIKVEQALMRLFPSERWTMLSHLLIWHGRRICDARKPRCLECPLAPRCPSAQLPA